MIRGLALSLAFLVAATPADAEIAVLQNGGLLKVAAWSARGDILVVVLVGGGEIEIPLGLVRALQPDEVLGEAARPTRRAVSALSVPEPAAPMPLPLGVAPRRPIVAPAKVASTGVDAVLARYSATR